MTTEDDDQIALLDTEKAILKTLANASTSQASIVQRAKIILYKSENKTTYFIVSEMDVSWKTVQKWARRWIQKFSNRSAKENMPPHKLQQSIIECLTDAPRRGRPSRITEEQIIKLINLACTTPKSLGLPLSHWSTRSLATHAKKMGIVSNISHVKVNSFLKSSRIKTS